MSKLNKLRTSPERFFSDSRRASVRVLGALIAPRIARSELAMELLERPLETLAERGGAGVRRLVDGEQARRADRRREILHRAGRPSVSVIMAAHDAASTVTRSLESLAAQTYGQHGELEILVVNDASADDTAARVRAFAASDARVRLLEHRAQRGAAMARNLGLSEATGDYLTFQDADDVSHPERIERQLAALLCRPRACLCVCNFVRETERGERVVVNGRRFAKNLISMVFPRDPVFERLGYMLELGTGEDAEYYERIKQTFGRGAEVHLFETLYRAGFARDSLLFSAGETEVAGAGLEVTHESSPEAARALEEALSSMRSRHRAGADPYVAFEAPRD